MGNIKKGKKGGGEISFSHKGKGRALCLQLRVLTTMFVCWAVTSPTDEKTALNPSTNVGEHIYVRVAEAEAEA